MISADVRLNTTRIRISARARRLACAVAVGNFACGHAFDQLDADEYNKWYAATSEDEAALLEYIAELESKIFGAAAIPAATASK